VWRDRRGVTAVVFALCIFPLTALIALGLDVSTAFSAKARLDAAADVGVLAGARTAVNALAVNSSNYIALGQAAGTERFNAQAGQQIASMSVPVSSISLTNSGTTILGVASWSATYTTTFGKLFGIPTWTMSGTSAASAPMSAPYLNVEVLLDNSGSMEIAATDSDIKTLQVLTACSTAAATAGQGYSGYGCSGGSYSYNGTLTCPIPSTTLGGTKYPAYPLNNAPKCPNNQTAQAPCAFACHYDTSKAAGTGVDYYAVARSTIGTSYQITLRFDLVKQAVNQLITTMQADDASTGVLNIGIFTFADVLNQVYPSSGEAGDDWAAATSVIGAPPTSPNQPDTGLQPYVGVNGGDTDFPTIMNSLANKLTASGNGTTAASPRKVLFLVTDGLQDPANRNMMAFPPSACDAFKSMGYTIYVVYTPYDSLMNVWYMDGTSPSVASIVQAAATTTNSIPYNLQQGASAAADFIEATDGASLQAAMQTFLTLARTPISHLTQ
jgi:Flp pilus assembly protein TadG